MPSFKGHIEFTFPGHGSESDDAVVKSENEMAAADSLLRTHRSDVEIATEVRVSIDGIQIDIGQLLTKYRKAEDSASV